MIWLRVMLYVIYGLKERENSSPIYIYIYIYRTANEMRFFLICGNAYLFQNCMYIKKYIYINYSKFVIVLNGCWRTFTKMQHINVFPVSLKIGKTEHLHASVDFQQSTKLMLLDAYWVYKLKQVDSYLF